jgi:ElaB/YqjD/DUF883 family membrane-anchored ribosome-binding protein
MSQTTRVYADKASEAADRAQEKVSELANRASARAHEAGDTVRDYGHRAADSVEETVHDRPLMTILGAVGIGLLIGALLKR